MKNKNIVKVNLLFIFSLFFSFSFCSLNGQDDLKWGKIKNLLYDNEKWKSAKVIRETKNEIGSLIETTLDSSKLMKRLLKISIECRRTYIPLSYFACSHHIKNNPQLKKEFLEGLFQIVQKYRDKYNAVNPLDTIGLLRNFYTTPPSKEEKGIFMELLFDENSHPLVRATCAYFLRNIEEPKARKKIKQMVSELLERYEKIYEESVEEIRKTGAKHSLPHPIFGDSRTIGRLRITLRVLEKE